jgi:hypothetical protein
VKSSTNVAGGHWRDKKQPVGEATDARLISDFLSQQRRLRHFEYFTFLDEPAVLWAKGIDQAVVIRDLGALKSANGDHYYLPGFSALHETMGREIALRNGSVDPLQFWTENYIRVAGRALGELAARTGMQFDSPHSQNFLIELDRHFRPTGKLVLRDMSDLYVDQNFVMALMGDEKGKQFLERMTQKENILSVVSGGFGPLHGNTYPSWVDRKQYGAWKDVFFEEFEKTFKEISDFELKDLKAGHSQEGDYFIAKYSLLRSPRASDFFGNMRNLGYVASAKSFRSCRMVLR